MKTFQQGITVPFKRVEGDINDNTMQGTHGATATSAVYITGTPAGAGTRSLRVDNNRCQSAAVLVGGAPGNFDKISLKENRIGSSATDVSISVPASSALVVTNSNVQALGNWPQFVPLNQHFGQCYMETYSNGSMTIRNLAASAATARVVW